MPSYTGRVMVDTVRGAIRVRKWPKKRGTPTSASQLWWIDWFRQANLLAKYVDAISAIRAIELTKKTGRYPRDILLAAMRGRLYHITDETGWTWYSMAARGDISETLDVLAQTVGSVLVRALDYWRPAGPAIPAVGHVLTYQGSAAPPLWAIAGAGIVTAVPPGTPIVPDGTKNFYDIDISGSAQLQISQDGIGFAGADRTIILFSIDGGATFKAGPTDYCQIWLTPTASGSGDLSAIYTSNGNTAVGHNTRITLSGLRAGRPTYELSAGIIAGITMLRSGFANFDGPITDVRIKALGGNNFNAGVIRMTSMQG